MGEVLENEVMEKIKQNEVPQEKDAYSIINYLKEHHSLMIAIVSAVVAVFSFVINIVNYLNVNTYLRFWDVEISQITFNSSNQIYSVFTAFFFQVIILFVTWFISNTYVSYSKRQQTFMYIKRKQKTISKSIKESYKELSSSEKQVLALKSTSDSMEEINEIEKNLENIRKEIANNKQEVKKVKKEIRRHRKQDIGMLVISNVISFLIIFWGCNILFTTLIYYDNAIRYSLLFSIAYVGVNALIYEGIYYFRARQEVKMWIASDREEIVHRHLPIEKVIFGEWKLAISNESFKSTIMQLIIITIIFMFSFSYAGYSKAKEQKEFQYVTSGAETYVVIYNNGTDIVTKKASIDADNITIDLSVQKTVSVEDAVLYTKNFSKVEIIRP